MTRLDPPALTPATGRQPRAIGDLVVSVRRDGSQTRLDGLRQMGSLKALFPRRYGPAVETVFLNTAGGLTGGDRMRMSVRADEGAAIQISSQAAERAYRAQPGSEARLDVHLSAGANAALAWIPQETLLFDGAALRRRLTADITGTSRLLIVEPLILGRPAMGEVVRDAAFHDRWQVRCDGSLIFADAVNLSGDLAARLDRPGIAGGAGAMASVLLAAPEAEAHLPPLRALLPDTCGASVIRDGLLFLRLLAPDGFALRKILIPVIEALSLSPLPKVWRL